MATRKESDFNGKRGGLLFYDRQGKHIIRVVPRKGVQTKATQSKAALFGRASALAKAVRTQLSSVIPFPADNDMQTRLITAVFKWFQSGNSREERLENLIEIRHFQFTTSGFSFAERWNINPELKISEEQLQIQIPAFIPKISISAPAHTKSIVLRITAAGFNPANGVTSGSRSAELLFNYGKKKITALNFSFTFPMAMGSLVIVGATMEYTVLKNHIHQLNRDKRFMPAAIIGVMYV
jgi:hypothetical protein